MIYVVSGELGSGVKTPLMPRFSYGWRRPQLLLFRHHQLGFIDVQHGLVGFITAQALFSPVTKLYILYCAFSFGPQTLAGFSMF